FEGGEITARGTHPSDEGGAERGVSVVAGFGGDRGRVTFALEADHRDTILTRDRWYTVNTQVGADPLDFNSWTGLSFYGRNVIDYSGRTFIAYPMISAQGIGSATNAAGAIDPANEIGSSDACQAYGADYYLRHDSAFPGDFLCGYDHTGVSAQTAQLDRLSGFMTAEYEINSNLVFNAQLLAARVESWGRYAPAAAPVEWLGDPLPAEEITYNGTTYTLNPIDTGDVIYMRWDMTGPARDTWQYDYQYDFQTGLVGYGDGYEWNVNYQYDIYDMSEWGNGFIHNLGVGRAADLGWDPRHPNQDQYRNIDGENLLGQTAAPPKRRAAMIVQRPDVGLQLDGPMMGAGQSLFYVGGEYRDEQYFDETLAQMEVFNIGGTAGGSSGGSRSMWAAFAEASLPLLEGFELNPAIRYDSYSDFGTNFSYKLAARWQPVDYWLLRASYGTGFRAPSLDELYSSSSQSFEFADDLAACAQAGIEPGDCIAQNDQQYETYFNSNPNLDAEESTQYLLGTVFDFSRFNGVNLQIALDYYYTEIENVVTSIGTQDVFWLEHLRLLDNYPDIVLNRAANGRFE